MSVVLGTLTVYTATPEEERVNVLVWWHCAKCSRVFRRPPNWYYADAHDFYGRKDRSPKCYSTAERVYEDDASGFAPLIAAYRVLGAQGIEPLVALVTSL